MWAILFLFFKNSSIIKVQEYSNSPQSATEKKRFRLWHEIINTEVSLKMFLHIQTNFFKIFKWKKSFCEKLDFLISKYKTPLEELCGTKSEIVSKEDILIIFGKVDPIYQASTKLIQEWQSVENSTSGTQIGSILCEKVVSFNFFWKQINGSFIIYRYRHFVKHTFHILLILIVLFRFTINPKKI